MSFPVAQFDEVFGDEPSSGYLLARNFPVSQPPSDGLCAHAGIDCGLFWAYVAFVQHIAQGGLKIS